MVMPLGNRGKEDYFKFWCMCAHVCVCACAHTPVRDSYTKGLGWGQSGWEHTVGMNHLHVWITGFCFCPMDTVHRSYSPYKVITATQQSKKYGNLIRPTVRFFFF